MADDAAQRAAAARALGRFVTSAEGRRLFQANQYVDGSQLVVALESDRVVEVLNRARRYPPPVTAAVYYPETGQFRFMGFEPTSAPEAGESDKLGSEISIGMLIDAAQPATNRFTIDNGWAMPILAHELSAV